MYVLTVTKKIEDYSYDTYNCDCDCCCTTTSYAEKTEPIAYFSTIEKAEAFVTSCRRKGSKTMFKAASPLGGAEEVEIKEVTSFDPETYLTL